MLIRPTNYRGSKPYAPN